MGRVVECDPDLIKCHRGPCKTSRGFARSVTRMIHDGLPSKHRHPIDTDGDGGDGCLPPAITLVLWDELKLAVVAPLDEREGASLFVFL